MHNIVQSKDRKVNDISGFLANNVNGHQSTTMCHTSFIFYIPLPYVEHKRIYVGLVFVMPGMSELCQVIRIRRNPYFN